MSASICLHAAEASMGSFITPHTESVCNLWAGRREVKTSGILFPELPGPLPSPKVNLCHSQQLWKCNRKPTLQSANTSDSKVNNGG